MGAGDLVVVSPDVGGVARARAFAKKLSDAPLAIVDKRRSAHNESEASALDISCSCRVLSTDCQQSAKRCRALSPAHADNVSDIMGHTLNSTRASSDPRMRR
jgi:phosphoribosylpyrophosphate synthetase